MPNVITAETVLAEHDDDIIYCGEACTDTGPVPYLRCVRPQGHGHDHAAVIGGVLVATWPQEATVAADPDPRAEEYRAAQKRWDAVAMRLSRLATRDVVQAILDPVLDRLDNVGRSFVVARSQRDDARRNALDVAHALDEIRRIANEVR